MIYMDETIWIIPNTFYNPVDGLPPNSNQKTPNPYNFCWKYSYKMYNLITLNNIQLNI